MPSFLAGGGIEGDRAATRDDIEQIARQHTDRIAAVIAAAVPGSYSEIEIPFERKPGPV